MNEDYEGRLVLPIFFLLYLVFCDILYALIQYAYGGNSMEQTTEIFSWTVSAIGILGFLSTVIQQILFYKRDSKTMDRIENGVSAGHKDLNDRMEREHRNLNDQMERGNSQLLQDVGTANEKILSAIADVDKRLIQEFTEQKAKQTYLQGNERVILESIDNLKAFAGVMEELKKENVQLKEQNRVLMMENRNQQEKIKSMEQQLEHQRGSNRKRPYDMEHEPEL